MNELERTALNEIMRTATYIAEKVDELDMKLNLLSQVFAGNESKKEPTKIVDSENIKTGTIDTRSIQLSQREARNTRIFYGKEKPTTAVEGDCWFKNGELLIFKNDWESCVDIN